MTRRSAMKLALLLAAAAVASAALRCHSDVARGPPSPAVHTALVAVTTTVRSTDDGDSAEATMDAVRCFVGHSEGDGDDDDAHAPVADAMERSAAQGNTWTASLALREGSALAVATYCVHSGQRVACSGGSAVDGPALADPADDGPRWPSSGRNGTLAGTGLADSAFQLSITPNPGSDNVIGASQGLATLSTKVAGPWSLVREMECFAWYCYLQATDQGQIINPKWGHALSMRQTRVPGDTRFVAQMPVVAGHVLQATSYCVAGGQLAWAANGNTNFRMPPDQQHPAGSISFQLHRTTPVGLFALPAATGYFDLAVGAVFMGTSGTTAVPGASCVARYGNPLSFGGVWPFVNETLLAAHGSVDGVDQFSTGLIPLPPPGRLMEITARCVYEGIESWLGANIRVRTY
eukprot:m51a1_g10396 hypothetical protein (406) ;mRNA; r:65435-66861